MRSLHLLVLLLLASFWSMAFSCSPTTKIVIDSPTPLQQVANCSVQLEFRLVGAFSTPPSVTLNFCGSLGAIILPVIFMGLTTMRRGFRTKN